MRRQILIQIIKESCDSPHCENRWTIGLTIIQSMVSPLRADGRPQRAKIKGQRADSRLQRAESRQQRVKSKEQRAESKEYESKGWSLNLIIRSEAKSWG
jgi:hypothetical protein